MAVLNAMPDSASTAALVAELSSPDAAATLRLGILRHLDQFGPQAAAEIPRAWPVTRGHMRAAARRLAADGLVEVLENGAGPVAISEGGRRVLDEIDWTETVRSMQRDGEL
jgi:hypothetical protein